MNSFGRTFAAGLILVLEVFPAHASLRLCNRTSYILYAATGVASATDIVVRGWTRIVPGACRVALNGDLAAQAYYLYARSSPAHSGASRAWSGQVGLCAKDKDFALHVAAGSMTCATADANVLPFALINTHHMRSWTTTFRETPDFDSMQSAERAGLERLLSDIGERGANSPKAIDLELLKFRKRLHMPPNARIDAVFDALETESLKTAAPLGYTICNDTVKPVWAAIGEKNGGVMDSRGWWAVGAESCTKVIAQSVAGHTIYLHVERAKNKALVSGSATFCVTNIEFEVQDNTRCAARGLREVGFAATNLNGSPGFTAHISDDGLVSVVAGIGTSK
jgi:uncharacterized membrane protein